MYEVGEVTGDGRFSFQSSKTGTTPMNLALEDMFGSSPKTIMADNTINRQYAAVLTHNKTHNLPDLVANVLKLESGGLQRLANQ